MKQLVALLLSLALMSPLQARQYNDVTLDETIELAGQELVLNGAGTRARFFVDLYVAALYLPKRTERAEDAIGMAGPKRMLLHVLYDEISRDKLIEGFGDGLRANLKRDDLARLTPQIEQFDTFIETMHKGDRIAIDFLPDEMRVTVGDTVKGSIEGRDFQAAFLEIWLGAHPISASLKRGLLGR